MYVGKKDTGEKVESLFDILELVFLYSLWNSSHTMLGITFPQFAKIDVVGENAIPLFKWLAENTSFNGFGKSPMARFYREQFKKMDKNYKNNTDVKWNFTKFLIDRNGEIFVRFEPADMKNLKKATEKTL